jgi:uncharacterized membrane protein YdjX (TVP38/TMEM64 family)
MATAEPHPGMRDALPVATVVLAAVAVVGLVTLAVVWLLWGQGFSVADVKSTIVSWGAWGVLASIGLMVLHSFVPFPAEIVACANGMAYGPLWGTVLTWTGAMLGAFAAFGLSRKLGRPFVEMVVARRKWRTVDEWTARQGWQVMLVSRFTPVVAFNLINYAAGLTRISWSTFTWTTGLGILPLTVLMVVMGDNFDMLPLWGWLALFAVGLLFWIALRTGWRRRAGKASVGKNS